MKLTSNIIFLLLIEFFISFGSFAIEINRVPNTDTLDYNFFSPNNDTLNQFFIIESIKTDPSIRESNTFTVFNRWGDLVYKASPYINDWDGTCNQKNQLGGKELPEGVYFYRFEYKILDKTAFIDGKIILKR